MSFHVIDSELAWLFPGIPVIPSDQALRGLRIDGVFCQLTNGGAWTLRGMCFPQVLDLFVSTVPAFLRSSLVPNNIGPSKQKLQAAYLHLACFVSIDQHLSTWDSPWFHMIFHDFPYDFPWFWMISRFWTIKKKPESPSAARWSGDPDDPG